MTGRRTVARIVVALCAIAFVLAAAFIGGRPAEQGQRAALVRDGHAAAELRTALLLGEIARFRLLPIALADDADLVRAVAGGATATLDRKLEAIAGIAGAAVIYVLDPAGRAIAASNWRTPTSFVGSDYAFRLYYRDAVRTGTGSQFALGTVSGRPGLFFSQRGHGGSFVVVKREFDRIEREWARAGGVTFVTDADGIILISSRPELRFRAIGPVSVAARARFRAALQSRGGPLLTEPILRADGGKGGLVTLTGVPDRRLLWSSVPAGDRGWRLNLLAPVDPQLAAAKRLARAATGSAAALALALAWLAISRHRSRRLRSRMAAVRTRELETLVDARTAELRAEMAEREAGERRATELREGLRQANRLASLGQITAGIAHETAQPVAAIRSYAANGLVLLDRGDAQAAAANFTAIAGLTERIGAVTAQLRGFARKGAREIGSLRLSDAIDGVTLMLRERLARADFVVTGDTRVVVLAGRIRLEQVLVNLLQNALEALEPVPDPRIMLSVSRHDAEVRVQVSDNGPGVDTDIAERIFTPFVTSRPTGLGLGLVIAHDIMSDMGGSLALLPSAGGAVFELRLRVA